MIDTLHHGALLLRIIIALCCRLEKIEIKRGFLKANSVGIALCQ
jgi:hypothetical protein